jgi:quercetin dioxygenase-like cupin family protein
MELKVTPWSGPTPPEEEELQNQLAKQDLKVYHWSSAPEAVFFSHTHGYHKILYIISGSIKFDFPSRHKVINLHPGDRLDLPAGIRHSAVAGTDGVTCLEAHIY